ncbi:MAG: carbohydrate-binding family 9-like protein [Pseudomonadota bacterium]
MTANAYIASIADDFDIHALDHLNWQSAKPIIISRHWSGEVAPTEQHCEVRMLWSDTSLYVRFDAEQHQPLNVSESPDRTHKTMNLWDHDVCELFIAPDADKPQRYVEFEVAPTGEWIDLIIEHTVVDGVMQRVTDWGYESGMTTAAQINDGSVVSAFKVDWARLNINPQQGDAFKGNVFRAMGHEPERTYLTWLPTRTDEPNFHVVEAFGLIRLT